MLNNSSSNSGLSSSGHLFNCVKVLCNATFYCIMNNELEAEAMVAMIRCDMQARGVPRLPVFTIVPHWNPEFDK